MYEAYALMRRGREQRSKAQVGAARTAPLGVPVPASLAPAGGRHSVWVLPCHACACLLRLAP